MDQEFDEATGQNFEFVFLWYCNEKLVSHFWVTNRFESQTDPVHCIWKFID